MNDIGICDYSDYDYKTDFWENANRRYEHQFEITMVARLLNVTQSFNSILMQGVVLAEWHLHIKRYLVNAIWLILHKIYSNRLMIN